MQGKIFSRPNMHQLFSLSVFIQGMRRGEAESYLMTKGCSNSGGPRIFFFGGGGGGATRGNLFLGGKNNF